MSWTSERARIASLSRSRKPDDPELIAARRNLKEARLALYIQRVIEGSPALTEGQCVRLAALLSPGGGRDGC